MPLTHITQARTLASFSSLFFLLQQSHWAAILKLISIQEDCYERKKQAKGTKEESR